MDLLTLVKKSRSYRRFNENHQIDRKLLFELVELAQYSPTGSNLQPLKFWLSNSPEMNNQIFPQLAWAGALETWDGPEEGERPSAYIIILNDNEIRKSPGIDHGIAAQSIMLGAAEKGLGGCMVGSIKREALQKILNIPEQYEILLVLALGKPTEKVVTEPIGEDGDIRYYRDDDDVHHVPKRSLKELIINEV
ncbi:MAG: nitroreductase family protein [Brevefilum fermentans]|jgi:nitroreductase|uniref:Nitroreductase family protein n=1 Tax=Candidatus Brevifilum fermentans TaxID=1986204 RepID=A0A1Y6K3I5_9CHLR|nr:nitroreductase family protein [Brevefilum fermentans]SMX53159.1 Nitroreductase family protein [Brevefilum fermentans]